MYFKTIGGSMRPLINSGQIVFIERVPTEYLSPGDCIAYKINNKVYLHRLINVEDKHLIVVDDANIVGKIKIPVSSFVGKLVDKRIGIYGYTGVIFSYFTNLIFKIFRPVKTQVKKIYKKFTFFNLFFYQFQV